jgi:hypothetical protein
MLVARVFPEQQDQPYGVLPRRPYIIGWDARRNLEQVEEGIKPGVWMQFAIQWMGSGTGWRQYEIR